MRLPLAPAADEPAATGLRPDDRLLHFDFPGIEVGIAEYPSGPTGCTVIRLAGSARTSVDARGGAVGLLGGYGWNDAICFAGGSLYGLEACAGVTAALAMERTDPAGLGLIPAVSGAIVYDYGFRSTNIHPDKRLGALAFDACEPGVFPQGRRGAGVCTTVGKAFGPTRADWGGQGAAFRQVGAVKILVISVVNALGVIVSRDGWVFRGNRSKDGSQRRSFASEIEETLDAGRVTEVPPPGNTTLTAVVTNYALDEGELTQLARLVHASMARAIQPFHTEADGDVLFAITTDQVRERAVSSVALGVLASEVAWDAVLAATEATDASIPPVRSIE